MREILQNLFIILLFIGLIFITITLIFAFIAVLMKNIHYRKLYKLKSDRCKKIKKTTSIIRPFILLLLVLCGFAGIKYIIVNNNFSVLKTVNAKSIIDSDYYKNIIKNIDFKDEKIETENFVYFNQEDRKWANKEYGIGDLIKDTGCGPTSLAMVVSTLTDKKYNPKQMCDWAYENGYWSSGSGSYHSIIPNGAAYFGLNCESAGINDIEKITEALSNGKLIIALMGQGHFTASGHFIVLKGITEEGKIIVADSKSEERSEKLWDFDIILTEARANAQAGGPFWIISN